MPTFDFSIPKKKTKNRKKAKGPKLYKVIEQNVTGIVWINKNAEFTVKVNSANSYEIHKDCYSCKGKDKIYTRHLDNNHRVCVIRNPDCRTECNTDCYLPFAPGCVVSGDIVINGFVKQFYIKKCWTELENNDAISALNYYKENYNVIIKVKQ